MQKFPPFFTIFGISLLAFLLGWGGLAYLVFATLPYLGPRWLFFFFLMVGVSGAAMPIAYLFNRRFPSDPPLNPNVIVREAVFAGIFACSAAWLQLGRMLTPGVAMIMASALLLAEVLLRMRERSQWSPKPDPDQVDPPADEYDDDDEQD